MALLVGRDRELGALTRALETAHGGRTRTVLVTGEAGIGKTRLVEEVVDHARDSGWQAVWGRSWEGGGAPEYWPWIEVLRALDLGDAVAELETARSTIDDSGARFRVFDRIATAVRGVTSTPTVVVLDDLHVADEPTVRLTQFVARSVRDAPLLLLGTHRDEPITSLVELGRDADVIQLGALTADDVREMLDVPTGLARRIAEVSGGNPFFADELARLWTTEADTRVPSGVRDVVRSRVAALPVDTIDVLSMAAIVGRSFDVDVAARARDVPPEVALDQLAPAARADLVRSDGGRRWQFVHDLVRAAIVDDLDPSVRGRRHHAVADVLEAIPATPPAVLAHHCWESGPLMDPGRARRWLEAAGEHARATLAYEDAARHRMRAATLADALAERWTNLMGAGEALRQAGDFAGARVPFQEACDVALALDDGERFAEAALGMAGYADVIFRPDVIATLERALAMLPPGDGRLRSLLLSNHATYHSNTEHHLAARQTSADALAMARRVGDDDALATALFNHHFMLCTDIAEHEARLPLAHEFVALADRLGSTDARINARVWLAHDLLEAGEVKECERVLVAGNALAEAARLRFGVWTTTFPRAFLALLRGDLELAERLGRDAYEAGGSIGFADVDGINTTLLFHLRRAQGRLAEFASALPPRHPEDHPYGPFEAATAFGLAEMGQLEPARDLLHQVLRQCPVSMQSQGVSLMLAETAILLDDADAARPLYGRFVRFNGMVVPALICGAPHGAIDRVLGGLAAAFGDAEAAARFLDSGRRLNEHLGFRLWVTERAPSPAPPGQPGTRMSRVRQDGEYWTFEHDGVTSRLRDSPGVRHLARLLLEPGREVHALDLSGSAGADEGGTGAVLDERAKEQYRRRLLDLQDEIDDATTCNDLARAEGARLELEAVVDQLSAAVGLGGRDRPGATATERARQSVTRAIKRAVDRVAQADPDLGAHLRATVRTGIYSCYTPDPAARVTWRS